MQTLIADTHVHLYPAFSVPDFLSGAAANFSALARELRVSDPLCMMCFVDVPGQRGGQEALTRLSQEAEGWAVEEHDAYLTLRRSSDGMELNGVPGLQLESSESLEVLALHCRMTPPEEPQPLDKLIELIKDAGGVPVVPWGVGKWTGARARVIQAVLGGRSDVRFADNGNRLKNTPLPATLRYAQDHGGCPLAGSDPLPLDAHVGRAGSYCTVWEMDSEASPDRMLRQGLTQLIPLRWAGELTSPLQFLKDQVTMQRNKHFPR